MASTFMKMFNKSKKHNKENEVSFARNRDSRCSTKSNSGWDNSKCKYNDGGVYTGNVDITKSSYAYSVPTAPKKTRGPRSCPGVPMYTIDERHSLRETKGRSRQNPYVNESYYEGKKHRKHEMDRMNQSVILNTSLMSQSTYHKKNHNVLNNRNLNEFISTSEYDSSGPSPLSMCRRNNYKISDIHSKYRYPDERDSLNYTDNDDTDYEDNFDHLLRMKVKEYQDKYYKWRNKAKEMRNKYASELLHYQNQVEKLEDCIDKQQKRMKEIDRRLSFEVAKNRELEKSLRNADEELKKWKLKVKNQENMLSDKFSQINHSHTDESTIPIAGAGEALCVLTDSNADILNNLAHKNKMNSNLMFNNFIPRPGDEGDDDCYVFKNTRHTDNESTCNLEQTRDCPRSNSVLSQCNHPSPLEPYVMESVCTTIEEEYCSLTGDEMTCDKKTIQFAPLASMEKFDEKISDCISVTREEKNEKKENIKEIERNDFLDNIKPSSLRKSFSDSNIQEIRKPKIKGIISPPPSLEEYVEKEVELKPPLPPKPSHLSKYKTKAVPLEEYYPYSSDDEIDSNTALIERQLRKRGNRVKFVPPRKVINSKTYSCYRNQERKAMETFEYLHDFSTDVSGLQSSPDYISPYH
uniref:FH2 domain-containing protein n=1 Tax=Strongyloides venezuelensis TaxID=75913 RepID=A0A0K0F481_STRVS